MRQLLLHKEEAMSDGDEAVLRADFMSSDMRRVIDKLLMERGRNARVIEGGNLPVFTHWRHL